MALLSSVKALTMFKRKIKLCVVAFKWERGKQGEEIYREAEVVFEGQEGEDIWSGWS